MGWKAVAMAFGVLGVAAAAGEPTWELKPEIDGIIANVPPLKRPLEDWPGTIYWWQAPLSFDQPEKLKAELGALRERGLVPSVALHADYADSKMEEECAAKCVAQSQAVAAAGFPVNIQVMGVLGLYRLRDGKLVRHADASTDTARRDHPCLILRDGWNPRADRMRLLMRRLADAKVPVAAVWYDYEGHPDPWNGVHPANMNCPSCQKAFPKGVLDNRRYFSFVYDLRAEALGEVFAKPVKESFPAAKVGFYDYSPSSVAHPTHLWLGYAYPPSGVNPKEIDVAMPSCYAWKQAAGIFFNADWPSSKEELDCVYFSILLRCVNNVHWNLRTDQRLTPWVSSVIPQAGKERAARMSKPLYREFLRHAMLRGARGFACYNVAPPFGPMPDYYEEMADINDVYNEMLPLREYLDGGEVLNDQMPDPKDHNAVVWSGMRKGDKALVRIVTFAGSPSVESVSPFPGVAVRLLASPCGKSYIVDKAGTAKALD